jgi:hypothetical protein
MWDRYTSATALSTASNFIMKSASTFTHTYRAYIKLRKNGKQKLKFWTSNIVDSTWADGTDSKANLQGGPWKIESCSIADGGPLPDGSVVVGTGIPVTYGGERTKTVEPGEAFWSDEVEIKLPDGHFLAFTWTLTSLAAGDSFPYNTEGVLVSAYDSPGNKTEQSSSEGFSRSTNCLVLPDFIGCEAGEDVHRIGFFGDSITQGVRTRMDGYEYWVARIAEELPLWNGVWNLGSGWARAYDAASDGAWLNKAKLNDEVVLILGVNDIGTAGRSADEVLKDLNTIISKLKDNRRDVRIILFTVPTFNFTDMQEQHWRKVNETIRSGKISGVEQVFDMAAVLSQPAPQDHLLKPEYMSDEFDPHPNGIAGAAIATAFLDWYGRI